MRLFSVFSRVPRGLPLRAPFKLTCHSPSPGGVGGGWKNHKIGIGCIPPSGERRAPAKPSQYSFDGRSFNINCGFSADGNVFFIGTVTLWWSGRPVVCDALWCVVDELRFYTRHIWMRLFRFKCRLCLFRGMLVYITMPLLWLIAFLLCFYPIDRYLVIEFKSLSHTKVP